MLCYMLLEEYLIISIKYIYTDDYQKKKLFG